MQRSARNLGRKSCPGKRRVMSFAGLRRSDAMEAAVSANGSFITPEAAATEALFRRKIARWRWTSALVEFLRFGIKQGWACLFGGIAVGLMISTAWFYPAHAPLALRLPVFMHARCPDRAAHKRAGDMGRSQS